MNRSIPDIEAFVARYVTGRPASLFAGDVEANDSRLQEEVAGKSLLVIGGAGSIGSSFIKSVLPYRPAELVAVDLNENGLTELTRDLRSSGAYVPPAYRTYTLDFGGSIFERMFRQHKGFDIVANFSAHKHVRSEKDVYAIAAMLDNNVVKAKRLLDLLTLFPPQHFFCVSTDKAANPVNVMGASKRLMEELIMAYRTKFKVTTARFANVAFSNGSLPAGFVERLAKRQPIVAPADVWRYFVSPAESGQICMLAALLGQTGEIFFPLLPINQMQTFATIADRFVKACGYRPHVCGSEEEARQFAAAMPADTAEWPVYYSPSDTDGEKEREEFVTADERADTFRFEALGVIRPKAVRPLEETVAFLNRLEGLLAEPEVTKQQVVEALEAFVPHFKHLETGKNLDQKM